MKKRRPVRALEPVTPHELPELTAFLTTADLTLSGLDAATVRLWILRGSDGTIEGTTGFELSDDGAHALIRSVAVAPGSRGAGLGLDLAQFALDSAAAAGASHAWLFSRRSGPFWQKLGFEPAELGALAEALDSTHQVTLFRQTGQLQREVAWSRAIGPSSLD